MIKSYWKVKDFYHPRKYYKILKKGLENLEEMLEDHELVAKVISTLQAEK